MKKTDLYLTEQQLALLKELSANTGLTVSEHIRRAVDEYLQKHRRDTSKAGG